jgi:putative tricarboxylic transport membrane protein
LFLGIVLGLVAGLLPGVGSVVTMIAMFPILVNWPPETVIIFYAVLIQSNNFSSSVSALNLGLLGDITSEPALRERYTIIKNALSIKALKYTALSSVFACVISLTLFLLLFDWISNNPVILRTEIKFVVLWAIAIAILFWPSNRVLNNLFLLVFGILLATIGHHEFLLGSTDVHVLTFGYSFLYGGIPTMVILLSCLAIPALIKLHNSIDKISVDCVTNDKSNNLIKFNLFSCIRGSVIGSFMGVIPMIGAVISSNVSWTMEKLFYKNKSSTQQSMNRLVSAEAANNSANITVLIPLLIFGLAIIPSELILLSIIEIRGWTPSVDDLEFYQFLIIGLLVSCVVCYLVCYTFVIAITDYIKTRIQHLTYTTLFLILASLIYSGWLIDNYTIFLLTFFLFSAIVLIFKKVDFMPLAVGFLLSDGLQRSTGVIYNLYF